MVSRPSIEIAYSFFHQKLRVYEHSALDWQRDDIEVAIADFVAQMNGELYRLLAHGRADYLLDHERFADNLRDAVRQLESLSL
ncbi:MAG: hypothetical protein IJ609_02210 [Paludibacteraceae bacterium]|nr:hypothetical protein [Paludibacteraceae bacterium]